ncbi:MAG TPA: PQQ-binding-like beta-propeller repeat protein [Pyrinomonadaceae bacterium]|nr:PQQ-binding-like beta-propeller repeat protein [Pyrinomonadaceae bacterium]
MKNLPRLLPALIFTLFATTVSAQQARNLQIDATHTGSTTTPHLTPPLRQRWSVNFGERISYPLIVDGKVFVTVSNAGSGTTLFALNAANGGLLWSFDLSGSFRWSGLCYENGRVFAVNGSGLLRAFDGTSGAVIWQVQLPGQFAFSAPPTVSEGVIYVGGAGSGGTLYAVNANSGSVVWTMPVLNGDTSSPAVTSNALFVSYSCQNVYRFDPVTGAQIWHVDSGCSGGGGTTPVLYNGRLYVRDILGDAIFDSDTGQIIGSFNAKNPPVFSGNRGFFLNGPHVLGTFGTLQARDVNTNSVLWSFNGDGFLQSAVLVVNDYVYVGSSQGNLYAVNAAAGQQAWVTNTGDSIPYVDDFNLSQPLTGFAAGEGLLVVPTSTKLIAYEGDTTPPTLTFTTRSPAPNSAGWNNTPVDVSFTTADDLSGVQSSDPVSPLHFASEGANQTQQVTVTDRAGNSATFTSPAINIDLTPPSTTAVFPGAGQDEQQWLRGPLVVTLNATDNLSGVAPGSFFRLDGGGVNLIFGQFIIPASGTHIFEYWSADVAGNVEPRKSRLLKIDPNPPVTQASVSGNLGTNGWYRSAVQVSLSAFDDLSGLFGSFYRIDGGATQTYNGTFVFSAPGQHTIEYWSVDNVNIMEAPHQLLVKIDTFAPVVTAAANPATAPKGPKPVNVTISGSATDALSGISSASFNVIDEYGATQPSGAVSVQANGSYSFTLSLPANRPGNDRDGHLYTIVVTGVDQAGNSATATTTFRIN